METNAQDTSVHASGMGVNAKVTLLIVAVSTLALLGFTLLDYQRATTEMNMRLHALNERVASRMEHSLRPHIWEMNWRSLLQVMHSEMQNRDLACISYQDASDPKASFLLGRTTDWRVVETASCPVEASLWSEREIRMQDALLGKVRVGLTARFGLEEIRDKMKDSLLRLVVLDVLLISSLYFALRVLLIKPVLNLSRVAGRMAQAKDFTVKAAGGGNDEIGLLVRNFNMLIDEVRNRELKLEAYSQSLENEVQARTRELATKAAELEAGNARLRELDDIKTAILSTVSHELRTPLAAILGFAAMLRKNFNRHFRPTGSGDPELLRRADQMEQNFTIIEEEGQRLTRLINDFLDLAKIEAGRVEWRDSGVNLAEHINTAIRTAQGQLAPDSAVALSVRLPEGPMLAVIDPDRFDQVIMNLIGNALKFTAAGSVTVTARISPEGTARICVADTGQGIPRQELTRIFDRFHQAQEAAADRKPGTGLGLAICRQIVEHYDGVIWAESEPGRGSRLYMELPLARQTATA